VQIVSTLSPITRCLPPAGRRLAAIGLHALALADDPGHHKFRIGGMALRRGIPLLARLLLQRIPEGKAASEIDLVGGGHGP
jgi:hypothetical protein